MSGKKDGNTIILAVEKDIAVHERETAEWKKHGVGALRVETMSEAIKLLKRRNDFLFIAINEDTVPDFMSMLPIMRDSTNSPIFIITSVYTMEKWIKAINCGADTYDPFNTCARENILGALTFLKAQSRRAKRLPKPLQILIGGDIILSPLRRSVYLKDIRIPLTKKEFDILHFLMDRDENVVTHAQLMSKIWGDEYKSKGVDVLWQTVNRLRRKLSKASPTTEYIEVERGVGYRFSSI
jgi:DNA-binding response OmpR family regulator